MPSEVMKGLVLVTNTKLPARVYLDDRALKFTSWPQATTNLEFDIPELKQ